MAKGLSAILAVCSLLLAREASAEENYALLQPAYQLDIHPEVPTGTPEKAVDGDQGQNIFSGQCIATKDSSVSSMPYPPWWVVRLSRWILPTAVTLYGRNDMVSNTRDATESFHIGPFWDGSLPPVVPTTLLSSDPLGGGRFFYLRSQGVSLFVLAGNNQRFPITTRASGRYFAIRSSSLSIPVEVCEVMVFGSANLLFGMTPTMRSGLLSPGVNLSVLTDESEATCWDPNNRFHFRFDFSPIVNLTTDFTVAVLTAGTIQTSASPDCGCLSSGYLSITTSENRTCAFVQSVSNGDKNYLSYACTCTACVGLGVSLARAGPVAASLSVCEVVAFNG